MANFSQVPGLAGYQQQVALNDQQGTQSLMKLSQLMNIANAQQGMQKGALEMSVMQDKLAREKKIRDALMAQQTGQGSPAAPGGQTGIPGQTSPSMGAPAGAGGMGRALAQKLNATADIYEQNGDFGSAMKIREHAQKLMPELKDEQVRMGPDGRPVVVRNFKDGTTEVSPFAPADKLHFADTGGMAAVGMNPYTGAVQAPGIAKTMSPEGAAANVRGWADIGTKREANQVARDVAAFTRTQNTEMKLADDYRVESKGFAETSTAMKKVFKALETADKNPGSALASGTAFMKVLDPNSVVRESELGMALNASGWFDRATNIANTLQSGRIMTKQQTANLRAAAEDLFQEAKSAQLEIDNAYASRAKSYGANPANVLIDRGQRETKKPPTGAAVPVKSETDALKLPAGTRFQLPDGRTGTAR